MDEIAALREHRTVMAPPSEQARDAARAALLRQPDDTPRMAVGLRRLRSPAIAVVAGAAAVAAAFVISVSMSNGPLAPSPAAAEALRAIAAVAEARQVDPGFTLSAEGQYRYTKSEGAFLSTVGAANGISEAYSVIVPKVRELWIAADGSGRIRETAGEPIFLGERDRQRWEAAGRPQLAHPISQDFGPIANGNGLFYTDLSTLPTDPDELAAVLQARAEEIDNDKPLRVKMFGIVGDLLRETVAPPRLRAALYRVAAELPGIELVGDVTDAAGRPGVAVAMTDDSGIARRELLIFDRDTSALLATKTLLLERVPELDADPPARIGFALFLESKIVDALP